MIKLLLKLAVVALLANAAFHVGSEYLTYVRFRDSIRDAAMYKAKNDAELMSRIVEIATQYDIPLEPENITIERQERRVTVDGWYDKPIELVPNYTYPWHFSLAEEIVVPTVVPLPGAPPRK